MKFSSETASGDPPPPSSAETLQSAVILLRGLLPSTLYIAVFPTRWQTLRHHLTTLQTLLSQIEAHSHHHPLLTPLLPSLLHTLKRVDDLHALCLEPQLTRGKLLMQSDLDMAANWLSKHVADLQLIVSSGVLQPYASAIVLSRPDPRNADVEEVEFFVRDLFLRLRIGGQEFKREALESLLYILTHGGNDQGNTVANVVAREGDFGCLVRLIDGNCGNEGFGIRELAVEAMSQIVRLGGEIARRRVFDEGALGPLLRVMEFGSVAVKEKAAMVMESITIDPENAWAVSAYGGITTLVDLCRTSTDVAKEFAVGGLRNALGFEDARTAFVEEGGIPVLASLISDGNSIGICGKAADCVSILAMSGADETRASLLTEGCLEKLLSLFYECGNDMAPLEQVSRAIYSFSVSDESLRILSNSSKFALKLADVLTYSGNLTLQHVSASLLGKLSMNEGTKKAISSCMPSLTKLMERAKPDGIQEVASKALISLLTVKSNRKEMVRDDKSLTRLVQMLDLKSEVVSKKFPVSVVAAILAGGSQGCRKRLIAGGAYVHLKRLTEMEVIGAKKALQRLSANRLTSIFIRTWRD